MTEFKVGDYVEYFGGVDGAIAQAFGSRGIVTRVSYHMSEPVGLVVDWEKETSYLDDTYSYDIRNFKPVEEPKPVLKPELLGWIFKPEDTISKAELLGWLDNDQNSLMSFQHGRIHKYEDLVEDFNLKPEPKRVRVSFEIEVPHGSSKEEIADLLEQGLSKEFINVEILEDKCV